ncbi:hypothetical protein K2P56_02020 [Patescibacteria group bacterium]|nr:hypothetical protein [Patescibacteria group bacterium]
MADEKRFRCPFETKGRKEGSILHIDLPKDRRERIRLIKNGFADFHADSRATALELRMPPEVLKKAKSNKDLKDLMIPYQADILTGELEFRLGSFMPYNFARLKPEQRAAMIDEMTGENAGSLLTGKSLAASMEESGTSFPREATHVAEWIEKSIRTFKKAGAKSPQIMLVHPISPTEIVPLVKLTAGSAIFYADRRPEVLKTRGNRNSFGIVRSPFFPEAFGRYSPSVDVVITKEADFVRLHMQTRKQIRFHSNSVLKEHGIAIGDLFTDLQQDGVWDHVNEASMSRKPE